MKKQYFLLLLIVNSISAQIVNIPNASFKAALLQTDNVDFAVKDINGNNLVLDANGDNEIDVTEALNVYDMDVSGNAINNLTGIEAFTNLRGLNISYNYIYNLDLTMLTHLEVLGIRDNSMETLNISGLTNLKFFDYTYNQLSYLDLSGFVNLEYLNCTGNGITVLDLQGLNNLETVWCLMNNITSLDVSGFTELKHLVCGSNPLATLTMGGNEKLEELNVSFTQLTSIDVGACPLLTSFSAEQVPLVSLFLKNGSNEAIQMYGNPGLQYVCVDESQVITMQNLINELDYDNCVVNSYCSFVPGGNYYTFSGNSHFDLNGNGCDVGDPVLPNVKFSISNNGNYVGLYIPDADGNYTINVQAGNYVITPILENSAYFTITPPSVSASFPGASAISNQQFCITPNGTHKDLEINLLPITAARPGFDAKYKLLCKNKGNVTLSGAVTLSYPENTCAFVDASPPIDATQNDLMWTFENLLPFESREIVLTLNLNSPVEDPPLSGGSLLGFVANVAPIVNDEFPDDNQSQLKQTVVNSLDPNDKTCVEGDTVTPDIAGKYVHYIIRFENTGTANAENIVVKDAFNGSKFNTLSLIPLDGSHPFTTKVTGTNKVEFIFENVQLPFDDANNDGYVAFKIKTLPTLFAGNTFSNTASIYFDYNAPIITNTATTTLQVLGADDFAFDNYFILYPNPANDVLTIQSKKNTQITSVAVYSTLGQLVLVIPDAASGAKIDVSDLAAGNYFLKVNSNKGASGSRFVKR